MPRKKNEGIVADDGSDIEQFGTIFDQLGVKEPTPAAPAAAPAAPGPDVAALLAKIDALSGTVNALASRPAPAPVYTPAPAAPAAPQWDWESVAMEPEKLGPTIAQYTNYVIEQREAAQREEEARRTAASRDANALWTDFSSTYKEYADKGDQVGYAYQKVTGKLAEKGINVAEYANLHRTALFKQVAEEYDSIFGSPKAVKEDSDPDDSNRTAGIFGGFESGGQPNKGKEQPGDMIKDLKDIQRASGFF